MIGARWTQRLVALSVLVGVLAVAVAVVAVVMAAVVLWGEWLFHIPAESTIAVLGVVGVAFSVGVVVAAVWATRRNDEEDRVRPTHQPSAPRPLPERGERTEGAGVDGPRRGPVQRHRGRPAPGCAPSDPDRKQVRADRPVPVGAVVRTTLRPGHVDRRPGRRPALPAAVAPRPPRPKTRRKAGPVMNGPQPLIQQTTPWRRLDTVSTVPGWTATRYRRSVRDGILVALVAEEPDGWHLSISFHDDCRRPSRYPTWDEITHARTVLLPADIGFVMHLPPEGEYVAVHPTTFHLFEHPGRRP